MRDTDAYLESARRTRSYGEAEWASIQSEAEAIVRELAALMRSWEPADGAAARALAERCIARHISCLLVDPARRSGHISSLAYPSFTRSS